MKGTLLTSGTNFLPVNRALIRVNRVELMNHLVSCTTRNETVAYDCTLSSKWIGLNYSIPLKQCAIIYPNIMLTFH